MMNKGAFKGILRKGLAFGMVGAMALSIAACGGKSAASSTTPATEAPAATARTFHRAAGSAAPAAGSAQKSWNKPSGFRKHPDNYGSPLGD